MYACGNCGASVAADATVCPRCRVSFSGIGEGSEAARAAKQQAWERDRAVEAKRSRQQDRAYRAWTKAADANAEALKVLEAFCAVIQQGTVRGGWNAPEVYTIDGWAKDVVWMRTPPDQRSKWSADRPRVIFTGNHWWTYLWNTLRGPRNVDVPTKKAIRYVADWIVITELRRTNRLPPPVRAAALALKAELDRLTK
jgi:hypothetical protein